MLDLDSNAAEILRELRKREQRRKLALYRPYGHPDTLFGPQNPHVPEWTNKPWQLEFHEAGATHPERMQMAANRVGKTEEAAAESSFHATGLYPDWWPGHRFDHGVLGWTGSPTNELSRDIVQKALLGGLGDHWGTGFLPVSENGSPGLIGKAKLKQAGIADVVDFVKIRHVSGDVSTIQFKSYDQGWRKFQGTEPDFVWLDEEPDETDPQKRIYTEVQTRILTSGGIIMVTFTPLLGETTLVRHFRTKKPPGTWLGQATWDDAPHLDPAEKERLKSAYPAHELKTRTKGVPMMGEGGVFPLSEEDIKCEPFEIPNHYARIKG
ncbi:MAG: terminase large subunit domain-containing protein, partial [Geminicoccaceae bacterium]